MEALAAYLTPISSPNLADRLVGESALMVELKFAARSIPAIQTSVIIMGELGTGKESLARYIHETSLRTNNPFVPVDCSSLDDVPFERELLGYSKGAFDGAQRDSLGFIRAADGGTIFLDEIGALTMPMQARLFEVLKRGTVVSVGDFHPQPVDVRFIAASNRDLQAMVQQGKFREDLFQALNGVVLKTPPLRARRNDILPLAQHFLAVQAELYNEPLKKISEPAAQVLGAYDWPGNVRELSNILEQAHVLASGQTLELGDLPLRLQNSGQQPGPQLVEQLPTLSLEELERQTILTALKRSNYNRALASRMLGINIQRLKRRITRFGLQGYARD